MKQQIIPKRPLLAVIMTSLFVAAAAPIIGLVLSNHAASGFIVVLPLGFLWLLVTYPVAYAAWEFTAFLRDPVGDTRGGLRAMQKIRRGADWSPEGGKLEPLSFYRVAVTDAGLAVLAALDKLESVHLRETQVTDEGVVALQSAITDCGIALKQ